MLLQFLVNNTILILLYLWYNQKLFSVKKSQRSYYVLLCISIALKSMLNLTYSVPVNLLSTILTYIVISTHFIASNAEKIVFCGFFITSSFMSEIIAFLIITVLFNTGITSPMIHIIGSLISYFLLLCLAKSIIKFDKIKDTIKFGEIGYFATFPIASISLIFLIINSNLPKTNPFFCLILIICLIIFNMIICIGFSNIIESKNIQIENEKLKNQELHYQLLEKKINHSKHFIHDYKKHTNLLNEYAKHNEYEKIKDYLNELSNEQNMADYFVFTGHQLIDFIINANKQKLIEYHIQIKHDVKIKDVHPISDFDFNIVFSNIFENAIESCIRCQGDFIKIKLDKVDNLIILKVFNSCNQIKSNFYTMKINQEHHGIGLQNINKISEKYDGKSTFKFDENSNLFISSIFFYVN